MQGIVVDQGSDVDRFTAQAERRGGRLPLTVSLVASAERTCSAAAPSTMASLRLCDAMTNTKSSNARSKAFSVSAVRLRSWIPTFHSVTCWLLGETTTPRQLP